MRTCRTCGQMLDDEVFYPHRRGRMQHCRACMCAARRAQYQARRERLLAVRRARYAADADRRAQAQARAKAYRHDVARARMAKQLTKAGFFLNGVDDE